jgi:uncharacterized membrane protein
MSPSSPLPLATAADPSFVRTVRVAFPTFISPVLGYLIGAPALMVYLILSSGWPSILVAIGGNRSRQR